jgi:hypothetical protein
MLFNSSVVWLLLLNAGTYAIVKFMQLPAPYLKLGLVNKSLRTTGGRGGCTGTVLLLAPLLLLPALLLLLVLFVSGALTPSSTTVLTCTVC